MLYSLQAELPDGFTGISEADKLTLQKDGNRQLLESSFNYPLRTLNFIAGPYDIRSQKTNDQTTLYTYFFKEDSTLAEDYLKKATEYLKRYEQMIGPYPFKRFSIVENRLPTGYGMPTFTLLGQAVVRLPFIKDTSLGHEILHSWFGNSILPGEGGNWLEGLTTYLADQLYAAEQGEGIQYRKGQLQRYAGYVPISNEIKLADFTNPDDSQPMARKIRAIGYDKSSMVFHMLRKELGDETFSLGLRRFYQEKQFQRAGWDDIEKIFSAAAKKDLAPFFNQWIHRSDLPYLEIEKVQNELKEGVAQISFHLLQKTKEPYTLIVPVRINTVTGSLFKTLLTSTNDDLFEIRVDELVTDVIIDPQYDLMRSLTPAELTPVLSLFDGAENKTIVLPENDQLDAYKPFETFYEIQKTKIVPATALKNSDFSKGSYLFLGSSIHSKSLFANQTLPENGCAIDARMNPLNPEQVMILISSSSAAQSEKTIAKIPHYGKYSYLHFTDGHLSEKRISASVNGIQKTVLRTPNGSPVAKNLSFDAIVNDLEHSKVVYVGENHTDYGSHLLQLQIIQAMYQRHPDMAIGMEMFPRSSQNALDEYLNGTLETEQDFLKKSKYFSVWGFDYSLYRPIIAFAYKNKIPLVGLNLNKEIVSQVFREGNTDTLSPEQTLETAGERDLDLPGYRERLEKIHLLHDNPHNNEESFNGFLQSQALWDETMAESITDYLRKNPTKKMIVLAGTGHVYKDNGIPPRVKRRMDVQQSVVLSINAYDNTSDNSSQFDYLMDMPYLEVKAAGKIGVALKTETNKAEPPTTQVRIVQVSHLGKAGQAGVRDNDIIVSVDGTPTLTVDDLKISLMEKNPGDTVKLKLLRENQLLPDEFKEVTVTLSSLENNTILPPSHPK
jgi:uncharacterized iron-regulated protein